MFRVKRQFLAEFGMTAWPRPIHNQMIAIDILKKIRVKLKLKSENRDKKASLVAE
jgi:hypothetical protein